MTNQTFHDVKTSTVIPPGKLYEVRPDGKWEFYFDHHMISGFMRCEMYFNEKHIKHIISRGYLPIKTTIGMWWATVMERYYLAISAGGINKVDAINMANDCWEEERIADLKKRYPATYEEFGGMAGSTKMMAQYYDSTYSYDYNNWKVIGVESGFGRKKEVKVGENDRVVVFYIGKPDLNVIESKQFIPVDHKTKDRIDSNVHLMFKPHPQTAGYIVAAQVIADQLGINTTVDRCIINVCARNEPSDNPRNGVKKPRFKRVLVDYSQSELAEWRKQVLQKATRLRYCIENDEWNWNTEACHTYSGCDFRSIHSRPSESRPLVIQSSFSIAEPWNPYLTDED